MSIIGLQILIVIGFIVGLMKSSYKLKTTKPHILSKSLFSYFLGR